MAWAYRIMMAGVCVIGVAMAWHVRESADAVCWLILAVLSLIAIDTDRIARRK